MSTPISNNLRLNSPKALDDRQGIFASGVWRPYNDLTEANTNILSAYRHKGLVVMIGEEEYWYGEGIEDEDLVIKLIPESQLPPVYFQDMTGSGTLEDPYSLSSVIATYLTSLPGYDTDKILYSDLTWQDAPSGGTQLDPPSISFGTITDDSIVVNWTSVTDATSYQLQIDDNSSFTSPSTLYIGSNLTYTESGLDPSTLYYFRVRAMAASFTSSIYDSDSATTDASGAPSGIPITSFTYLSNLSNTGNEIVTNAFDGSGGAGAIALKVASGQDGWITQKVQAFTESGEGATGVMMVGVGLDPFYGTSDSEAHISGAANGMVFYKGSNTGTGIITTNSILRLRVAGSTIYTEYSNDAGSTFTTITSVSRPGGDLRLKIGFGGNQYKIHDLRGDNLTAV